DGSANDDDPDDMKHGFALLPRRSGPGANPRLAMLGLWQNVSIESGRVGSSWSVFNPMPCSPRRTLALDDVNLCLRRTQDSVLPGAAVAAGRGEEGEKTVATPARACELDVAAPAAHASRSWNGETICSGRLGRAAQRHFGCPDHGAAEQAVGSRP